MWNFSLYKQNGFTPIELICSLGIVMLLASISLPALGSLMQANQSRNAHSALLTALNLARIEAISRQTEIVVCPSSNHSTCDDDIHWQHGWIVFEDRNRNGSRNADEPLLAVTDTLPGIAIVTSVGRVHVTYRPDGSATGTNLTFTFCDRRGPSHASTIVINNTGRARAGKPTIAQTTVACTG